MYRSRKKYLDQVMALAPENIKKLSLKQMKNVLSFHSENASVSVYSSYFGFHRLDIAWVKENAGALEHFIEKKEAEKEQRLDHARKQAHLENEQGRLYGTLKGLKKGRKKKK
tara:strand:+ start:284 stop:619 length:336 start_codon:yes stop_codon:yes gene_type:complete